MSGKGELHPAWYWRERAEEARSTAEGLQYPEARRVLLKIAAHYDELAEQADRLARIST
jgi:hypothetical protein